MMKHLIKLSCAAAVGTAVTLTYTGSAQAFTFTADTGVAGPGGVTNQGAFSKYSGQAGVMNIDFSNGAPTTGFAQYSSQKGSINVSGSGTKTSRVATDEWAPTLSGQKNDGKYLAVFNEDKVTIKLDGLFSYYGVNWGSISNNNTFSFLRGGKVIQTFTTANLLAGQPNIGSMVAANHGKNNQRSAYLHFTAGVGEYFDSIVIDQIHTNGTGTETDNHSFRRAPEPASMLGLAVVGGVASLLKRKRSA